MAVEFGYGMLWITLFTAVYAVIAAYYGGTWKDQRWVESARIAMSLVFPLLSIAVFCLLFLLKSGDFSVVYVYSVTSKSMPDYLKLTALWGGQAGSLLFWSWLMAGFASAVAIRKWNRDREFLPWVIIVAMITMLFFLAMVVIFENPFERYWADAAGTVIQAMFQPAGTDLILPPDGNGLNPLLRHPGMIIHPPMLYLGFVSFVIPFSFAIAALITGRTDDRWIRVTRRWTLVAWLFLTAGLVLGMRWAYDVLGWGGYWAWDPVEIAALMPWLSGTALLHSVMIQERRGMFKQWNMVLTILTYDLVIYGTFLTRSGVLSSVHSFAQSPIGPFFFGFIAVTLAVSVTLLVYRWSDLRSKASLSSFFSRESLFLFNNLLFMGILFICFLGVNYPLLSELISGQKVTMGPSFYMQATGPLWGLLLLLMGVAPLSAWTVTTGKVLGKSIWKVGLVSLIVPIGLIVTGFNNIPAIIGFWLVGFVISITCYEYFRGIRARMRATGENVVTAFLLLTAKNRRRYGGYIIHLGVVLMGVGIIGIELFQTQTQATLSPGMSVQLNGYEFTYKSLADFAPDNDRNITRAVIEVSQNGIKTAELYPRRDYYFDAQQPMTIPGLRSNFIDDLYVILVDWEPISSQQATFKFFRNPLVMWLWVGSLVLLVGSAIAVWPGKEKELEV